MAGTNNRVELTDLDVIARYSLAVRAATADRDEVIAALRADLEWLQGSRSRRTTAPVPDAPVVPAVPAVPAPAAAAATRDRRAPAVRKASAKKAAPARRATPAKKTVVKKAAAKKTTRRR
jgi:hypothetical protein